MATTGGFQSFDWVKKHIANGDKVARSSSPHYDGKKDNSQYLNADSIKFLHDQGIKHVISLNSSKDGKYSGKQGIEALLKDANIVYTHLPVQDFQAPKEKQLETGYVNFCKHRNSTLVWCGFGHGRTGTMISALQIYEEKEKAHRNINQVTKKELETEFGKGGANKVETDDQIHVLREILNKP